MKKYALLGILVALAFFIGRGTTPDPVVVTRVDTIPPTELLANLRALQIEHAGALNRLRARETVRPRVITRTDTLIPPPDTVLVAVRVDARGHAAMGIEIKADSLYKPELHDGIDLADCEDGGTWDASGEVVCDRARLGHLYAGFDITAGLDGAVGATGLWWQPSYRSGWNASLTLDTDGILKAGVRKAWRLF